MSTTTLTEDAEGKTVVKDGDAVGIVAEVKNGTAYVKPNPDITDKLYVKLGWSERGEDTYPLQEEAIDTVTDDEIQLKKTL
ncbi:PRC-barrel domain containing protein [Haloarchaeobius amylolyticus]|uniref:PRC-barrel domain containing protein n=1 Tax=Haloarchaeobius amylolyticus TaxID=1198296 RepID=UPI00226E4E21|nr:PRC-barrel domain containing protein [Haloarchaeobius amylolyticus]